MKEFEDHSLSIETCVNELEALKNLLASKKELKERAEILPFFKKHRQLSAYIGTTYVPLLDEPNKIAFEYDLFGDFTCDLVVGDWKHKKFLFVEFENAKKDSLFSKKKSKTTTEWGSRLDHGFSQVVDWFWILSEEKVSRKYEEKFGTRDASMHGLVVVGRSDDVKNRKKDEARLLWRQDHVLVDSKKITIVTFDQLAEQISSALFSRSRWSKESDVAGKKP